jgi:glycosyltransferase involved in cell wall biosynthesis
LRFSPTRRSADIRQRWGLDGNQLALVYAGRVSHEKGLALLPRVRALLQQVGIPHRWVVIGDGPMRTCLERRLCGAVFTGSLPHAEVGAALASADIFVFPSQTDTAGNVVLEAQACGLPALVTGEGGPSEIIVPGETGLVCRGGDAESLAFAITALAHDADRRRRMGARARAHALTRRWDLALKPLFKAYRELAGNASIAAEAAVPAAVSRI